MLDTLISGLITGNTYALIAVGLSLIFGVAELINFAHGSLFAIGAMLGWWLTVELGWPLWLALPGVVVATAGLGLVVERLCVRPFAHAPPMVPLLSTLALSLILDYGSQRIFSPETRRFPSSLSTATYHLGGISFGMLDVTILAVGVASVAALWAFLKVGRLGQAVRATAQDREAAQQMGISVTLVQGLTFAVASGLAGVAGVLIGMYYRSVSPTVGFTAAMEGFTAATLGGLGSLPGAIVGGLLLGVVESFGVTWFGGSARQLIAFTVLLGTLVLWPNGLFGSAGAALREPMTGTFFGRRPPVRFARWQLALAAVAGVVVLPVFGGEYLLRVATFVAIYATLALSLTLLSGSAGQLSLGQAGPFAIGAYASALLTKEQGWPFWLALPAACVTAGVLGAILVSPTLRLRGHYSAIATLGLGVIVTAILLNFEALTRGPLGIFAIPPPELFGYAITSPRDFYLLALAVLLLSTGLVVTLQRSHLGRAWRAIREDEIAARSCGVPVAAYRSLAFAVGALVAGLAGSLLAHQYGYISPDIFDIPTSLLPLTIVVLGGIANPLGAIVGAAVLVGAPELFRPLQEVRLMVYGLVLLVLVRFRPQGLLGSR